MKIKIQSDLSDTDKEMAESYADWFIKEVNNHNGSWKHLSRGGWGNGLALARGIYGTTIAHGGKFTDLVFRRIHKRKRIFGIVHYTRLVRKDNLKTPSRNQCLCSQHIGQIKIKMLPTDFYNYYG